MTLSGLYRAVLDHFGTKIGSFWGWLRTILGSIRGHFESIRGHFGIVFGIILGSLCIGLNLFSGLFGALLTFLGGFGGLVSAKKRVFLRAFGVKNALNP